MDIWGEFVKHSPLFAAVLIYVFLAIHRWKHQPEMLDSALRSLLVVFVLSASVLLVDLLLEKYGGDFKSTYEACKAAREDAVKLVGAYGGARFGLGVIPVIGYLLHSYLGDVCSWSKNALDASVGFALTSEAVYRVMEEAGVAIASVGITLLPPPNTRKWGAILLAVYVCFALLAPSVKYACEQSPSVQGLVVQLEKMEKSGVDLLNSTTPSNSSVPEEEIEVGGRKVTVGRSGTRGSGWDWLYSRLKLSRERKLILNIADAMGAASPEFFIAAFKSVFYAGLAALSIYGVAQVFTPRREE